MRQPTCAIVRGRGRGRGPGDGIGSGLSEPQKERALGVGEAAPDQATSVIGVHQRSAHRAPRAPVPETDGTLSAARPEPVRPSGAGDRDWFAEHMSETRLPVRSRAPRPRNVIRMTLLSERKGDRAPPPGRTAVLERRGLEAAAREVQQAGGEAIALPVDGSDHNQGQAAASAAEDAGHASGAPADAAAGPWLDRAGLLGDVLPQDPAAVALLRRQARL
jgi:hypothetical protein